mgnify:CR=1 FL=1
MQNRMEEFITELVVYGGNARSMALEAVEAAKKEDFTLAEEKIYACNQALNQAHEFQTDLLCSEASGQETIPVNLLLVHGQDHLMAAITTRDLALQMIEQYKIIAEMKKYLISGREKT